MRNIIDFHTCNTEGNLFEKVYEHLALPDSTFLGTRITKKMILENNDLSSSNKKLLNDLIQTVEWLNTLKPETLNIPTYVTEAVEYIEVAILKITLKIDAKNHGKLKSITKFFHTLIPYPVILLLELGEEMAISLADKRINQADNSKLVIENSYNSQWFHIGNLKHNERDFLNDFSLKNVSSINYYELYQDFISKLIALEISYISGSYLEKNNFTQSSQSNNTVRDELTPIQGNKLDKCHERLFSEMSNDGKTQFLKKLTTLEDELSHIRNKLKKEMQMNEKMRLNVQARKVKQAISEIHSQLS